MKKIWLWIATIVVITVVVAGITLTRGSSSDTPQAAPTCRPTAPPSSPPSGDPTGISVMAQGFSRVGGSGSAKASMGALLRNDTGKVAYRTLVTIDALDAAGRTVIHTDHQLFRTQVVPVIPPGDSIAVGSAGLLDEAAQARQKQIASITVTAQVSQWLEPGDGTTGLAKVSATMVAGSGKRQSDGQGELTYDFRSPNCAPMASRGVSMVFQDRSGRITGGSLASPTSWPNCEPGPNPGKREILSQSDIPADVDLDRTMLTVYCDFDRAQQRPAPGVPYN